MDGNEFLSFQPLKVEAVAIPEWGKTVHVREMTGQERSLLVAYDKNRKPTDAPSEAYAVWLCLCNEQGQSCFSRDNKEALVAIATKANNILAMLSERILALSGIGKQAESDIAKN